MKTKQTFSQILRNNYFLIKLCFTTSPVYFILIILESIRNEVVVFLEFTFGFNFVLESAEFGRPYRDVLIFLVGLLSFVGLGLICNAIVYQRIKPKVIYRVKKRFKDMIYSKAREVDLEYYDNPEYYNDFTLAVSESEKQIDRTFHLLAELATCLTTGVLSGAFFIIKDFTSLFFIVTSAVLSIIFAQLLNKVNFEIKLGINPLERKRNYVNRIFYLNEYAKEIRLNPEIADKLLETMEQTNNEIYKLNRQHARKRVVLQFMRHYVCNKFISEVLYISYLVYKASVLHSISYGNVAVFFQSSGMFKNRLRRLMDMYPYASETSLYVDKIQKFMALQPKITSEKGLQAGIKPKKIELRNVSFAYNEKDGNVLNNISMTIKPGEKIALVGYNGAGKTTLVKLIMRLYDTGSGQILVDGANIRDYDVEDFRNSIGAVFQDFNLYAATIKENVVLDLPEATGNNDGDVINALVMSGFEDRLNTLCNGLNANLTTEFENDGVNLSGGESQKIAVSRVFYKNCGLVILDEPSSSLDPISEYNLNNSMLKAAKNKTVIFISHRLSTTRHADRIYMLENGRIIEHGTHSELLTYNGKYAEMWRAQAGQYLAG